MPPDTTASAEAARLEPLLCPASAEAARLEPLLCPAPAGATRLEPLPSPAPVQQHPPLPALTALAALRPRRRAHSLLPALLALAAAASCAPAAPAPAPTPASPRVGPVDARATPETRALFANLRALAGKHLLFGHHDDLAYGFSWVAEPGRSDVKETAGAYPAVYGWDVTWLLPRRPGDTTVVQRSAALRRYVLEGYGRGGVITFCWHMANPVSGGNAWDTTRAVASILPGGARNAEYRAWLDTFASFALGLHAGDRPDGPLVPIIFRPFHEMTGSWFWWGGRHATPDEYRRLWRFTVEYLRDRKGVHNLLWAYSTDVFASKQEYLEHYPGDAYVDVLGYDDYKSIRSPATRPAFVRLLHDLVELADARGKIAALTETGLEALPDPLWWTGTLLAGLRTDSLTRRIVYALVWRNANNTSDVKNHFFAPYPGQASVPDFVRFRQDPYVLFEDELPDLYHTGGGR